MESRVNAEQRFCGTCGSSLVKENGSEGKTRQRVIDEAWESGKEQGRKEERERAANETKIYLWADIVLAAIGGGIIGGKIEGSPDQQITRVVVGILLGGFIGAYAPYFWLFPNLGDFYRRRDWDYCMYRCLNIQTFCYVRLV